MQVYANLHLHSIHSDGKYSPKELVAVAKAEGYKALAITDHDTATAYPKLKKAADEAGMECIFGVEFSVNKPKNYHIVGFDFDPEYPPMKKYLADMAVRQTDNTHGVFTEGVEKGYFTGITWEEILEYNEGIKWLCNEHIFNAMLDKGLVEKCNYMEWFNKYVRDQRGHYPPSIPFKPLSEIVSMIKEAGGFAVAAHLFRPYGSLDDVDQLIEYGVEGIEVLHPDIPPEEQERAIRIALEKDLFVSGGSDHSGLCGGCYSGFPSEEELKKSPLYIPEMSAGVSRGFYEELKNRKINREYRANLQKRLTNSKYSDIIKGN
ncbi:MAG: PHP domain-containing protein [Ruminococcaceae bacterium]|nr:PHP domain-containing protein [Oscillospiraceae bacterium]